MNSRFLRAVILPAALGLAGPFLWVTAMGWWSLYVTEPLFRWIWVTFQLKGNVVYFTSAILETIIVAALFGGTLHVFAGAQWLQAVIAFSVAFVLSLLAQAVWEGDVSLLISFAPSVAAILVCTAVVCAALSGRHSHDA
jgi:hypothetical protein